MLHGTRQLVISLSFLILVTAGTLDAQRLTGVVGVVRDTHGKPQMGVLVELLGSAAVATALTDLEGHYQIKDVLPGVYQVRASASLFAPSLRRQLHIAAGTRPIVNLTMSGLFDETTWLSSSHADTGNGPDDWKWTLRSPANRPMLRLTSKDDALDATTREQGHHPGESHAVVSMTAGSGNFGQGGGRGTLTIVHRSWDQKRSVGIHSSIGATRGSVFSEPLVLSMTFEADTGLSNKRRTDIRVRTFPQIGENSRESLTEVAATSAEHMEMGDLVALEVGSEMQILTSGTSTLVTHPFVHLTTRPIHGWGASYTFATAPGVTRYDDLSASNPPTPTAINNGASVKTEAGMHHEVAIARTVGRAKMHLAYSHDYTERTALTGLLPRSSTSALPSRGTEPGFADAISLDANNGSFRTFSQGYESSGGSMFFDLPVRERFSVSGGCLTSMGINVRPGSKSQPDAHLAAVRSQALLVGVQGHVMKTGTKVTASYRWQPSRTVSILSPYELGTAAPYLGVHVRQALPGWRDGSLVEITFDGDNLLQEGYQSYGAGRQEALLASALQELRAGLSFTF